MKMKDLMLDLATGDSSTYGAYIQEAYGQVKVSNAIFNAAVSLNEMPAEYHQDSEIVQEAYSKGFKSLDREDTKKAAEFAARQSLKSVFNLIESTSKNIVSLLDKSIGGYVNAGVSCGVPVASINGGSFNTAADKIANAIGGFSTQPGHFCESASVKDVTASYVGAMRNIFGSLGINFNTEDETIMECYTPVQFNTPKDLKSVGKCIKVTTDLIGSNEMCYTESVTPTDIKDSAVSAYSVLKTANGAAKLLASHKQDIFDRIDEFCDNEFSSNRGLVVTESARIINSETKRFADSFVELCDNVVKTNRDALYTVIEEVNQNPRTTA